MENIRSIWPFSSSSFSNSSGMRKGVFSTVLVRKWVSFYIRVAFSDSLVFCSLTSSSSCCSFFSSLFTSWLIDLALSSEGWKSFI